MNCECVLQTLKFHCCLDIFEPLRAPNAQLWVPWFSPDMPSTQQEKLPTQLIPLPAKPAEHHLVLSLTVGFASLSAGKILQTSRSHTSTENRSTSSSCYHKSTSHSPAGSFCSQVQPLCVLLVHRLLQDQPSNRLQGKPERGGFVHLRARPLKADRPTFLCF